MNCARLAKHILELFQSPNAAVPRLYVETSLGQSVGAQPKDVTSALKSLVENETLERVEHRDPHGRKHHIYAKPDCPRETILLCGSMLDAKAGVFEPELLKKAGESYARCVFMKSGCYLVPGPDGLGTWSIPGHTSTADLVLRCRARFGVPGPIVVEVKNQREYFYPDAAVFRGILFKAARLEGLPVIVSSHISPEGLDICRSAGIAVLHLGRQLVPNHQRRDFRRLFTVLGPSRYEYINVKRPFQHRISGEARRDIDTVSSEGWLTTAYHQWLTVKPLIDDLGENILKLAVWKQVRASIEHLRPTHDTQVDPEPLYGSPCPTFTGNLKTSPLCAWCRFPVDTH